MGRNHSLDGCTYCLCFLIILGLAVQSVADTFEWTDPVSSKFSDASKWTNTTGVDPAPPNGGDRVNFNEAGTYEVEFNQNEASDILSVTAGDISFLSSSATLRTFTLATGSADANISGGTIDIGSDSEPLFLNLPNVASGGGLNISVMNIGSQADGTVTVAGQNSRLDVLGATNHSLGFSGNHGVLNVFDEATANFGTAGSGGTLNVGDSGNSGSEGTVLVKSGSTLNTGHIDIAPQTSGATGTMTVEGSDSSINQTLGGANLIVGSTSGGTGILNVQSSGTFDTGTGTTTIRATGTVDIDGGTFNANGALTMASGSTLTLDGGALNANAGLNNSAVGTLDFRDGLLTLTNGTFIPDSLSPLANYTIDGPTASDMPHLQLGAGATSDIGNNLYVGNTNRGELTITGGEEMLGFVGRIGEIFGSTGTVTVNGPGSTLGVALDTFGSLDVGYGGNGTLNIQNGGEVFSTFNRIGSEVNSVGVATVNGTDSAWTIDGSLSVGGSLGTAGGTGTLNVQNNGLVEVAGTLTNWNSGTVTLDGGSMVAGSFDNSDSGTFNFFDGTFTVTGSFAPNGGGPSDDFVIDGPSPSDLPHLQLGAGSTTTIGNDLFVGNVNRGEMTVTSGGDVSNDTGVIGNGSGTTGTVTIDGAGSTWMNTLDLIVGHIGNGTLNIQNGGDVSNAGSRIGNVANSTGAATVDGAGSTWMNTGTLLVGNFGNGTLYIQNGGEVSSNIGRLADNPGTTAEATVDGADSSWTSPFALIVGTFGDGTLNIQNGGTVSNGQGRIGSNVGSTGTATVDGTDTSWTNTDLFVGGSDFGAGGTGTLNVQNSGLVDITGTLKIWALGTVILDDGTIVADTFDHTEGGTFDFLDGTLTIGNFLGNLTQDGGTISPGDSPGLTAVTGDFTINAGMLEIEIGGLIQATEYDFLDVAGDVALGGTLDVSLIDPFTLSPGQSFEIIDVGGSLSGQFSDLSEGGLVGNFAGTNLLITYLGGDGNDVTLLSALPGDFDVDGDVDGFDFLNWQRGESPDPLNQSDLDDWQDNFRTVTSLITTASAKVPEPATWTVLLIGIAIMITCSRAPVPKLIR
jgi:T5SS/PEP-CTERM-associated repeat protein